MHALPMPRLSLAPWYRTPNDADAEQALAAAEADLERQLAAIRSANADAPVLGREARGCDVAAPPDDDNAEVEETDGLEDVSPSPARECNISPRKFHD